MTKTSQSGGVTRRGLLAGVVGLGVGGGALWYLFGRNGDDPTVVATAFIERIDAGEFSEADAMIHPESPVSGAGEAAELLSVFFAIDDIVSAVSVTVTESRVLRDDGDEARVALTVEADLFVTTVDEDVPLDMRRHEGEWYVWNLPI